MLRVAAGLSVAIMVVLPASAIARQAYVANSGAGTVSTIDTVTGNAVGSPIAVGTGPFHLALTPDGSRAYVANSGSGSVSVIDTATRAVVATLTGLGTNPRQVAVSPDGARAYVVYENSSHVTVIDVATNTVVATIPAVGETGGLAVSPDGSRLYVTTDTIFDHAAVIDTAANTIIGTVGPVGIRPAGIAFKPDGSRAYIANWDSNTVTVVDGSTNQVQGPPILVGGNPFAVAVSPDGGRAYVTNFASGSISVIDTASRSTTVVPSVGPDATGVAVAPDGRRAYVTSPGAGTLSAVNTTSHAVDAVFGTGPAPFAVALAPNQPPVARFQVGAGAVSGAPVVFDASGSSDPDGSVARYDWDFGDGTSSVTDAGPAPAHTYEKPGTYRVTLTLTDDEGCSLNLVYTGQTALCNGSSAARTSVDVEVADPCASMAMPARPSVTRWRRLARRLRVRLRMEPGGHLRTTPTSARFSLQVRGTKGERRRTLGSVRFQVDGEAVSRDRRPPYSWKVNPSAMSAGDHTLTAAARSRYGDGRSLRLPFAVSACEAAAFSVSLSSKRPSTYPDLDLRVRAGSGDLKSVKFRLPDGLHLRTRGLAGAVVGAVKLLDGGRTRKLMTLRFDRASDGAVELAANTKLGVKLSRAGKRPALSLTGLADYRAGEARLTIAGRRTRMVRNPSSCDKTLKFAATVAAIEGEQTTLKRALTMCRTDR